jgi:hypothetical protein
MTTPAEDDYDKLTPEQREIRDKSDRAREAEEQASMYKVIRVYSRPGSHL